MFKSVLIFSILSLFISSGLLAQETQRMPEKKIVTTVRKMLAKGEIKPSKTCLDEYLGLRRRYNLFSGLTPPVGVVSTAGTTFLGLLGGGVVANLVGVTDFAVLGYMGVGGFAGLVAGGAATIGVTTWAVTKTVQNGFLIKTIANSYNGEGESLSKFVKKYKKAYPQDSRIATNKLVSDLIVKADQSGLLCDGTLTGKDGDKLKHLVANKKQIFEYIHKNL